MAERGTRGAESGFGQSQEYFGSQEENQGEDEKGRVSQFFRRFPWSQLHHSPKSVYSSLERKLLKLPSRLVRVWL
jgi:hypothetical protein